MNLSSIFEYFVSAIKAMVTSGQDCPDSNITDSAADIAQRKIDIAMNAPVRKDTL